VAKAVRVRVSPSAPEYFLNEISYNFVLIKNA